MKSVYVLTAPGDRAAGLIAQLSEQLPAIGYTLHNPAIQSTLFGDARVGHSIRDLRRADIVLAIVAEMSPNVFFELGYAAALGKPLLVVASTDAELPPDLARVHSLRVDIASPEAVSDVARALQRVFVSRPIPRRQYESVQQKLETYWTDPEYFEAIEPQDFEQMIREWCDIQGFAPTPAGDDREVGFDFALQNYHGHHFALVEVKKAERSARVSIGTVQRLMGNVYGLRADYGIIVSSGQFTRSAQDFAARCHPRIELWSMDRFIPDLLALNSIAMPTT